METFLLALIMLLPCSSFANALPRRLAMEHEDSVKSFGLASLQRELLQTEEMSAVAPETSEPTQCPSVSTGVTVSINEDSLLIAFQTANPFICCEACELNSQCTTWRRNQLSSLCELFSAEDGALVTSPFGNFDAGGLLVESVPVEEQLTSPDSVDAQSEHDDLPNEETQALGPSSEPPVRVEPTPSRRMPEVQRDVVAPVTETPNPCRSGNGMTYPNGVISGTGTVNSAVTCCEICRLSNNCQSWFYNSRFGRCVLNSNIPIVRNRSSTRFSGGTTQG